MVQPLESRRIVIAGASSLLGAELKSLLEESRFAASDFRLVDEESVAGTLTEAGGEAAVIQPVEEDSFDKAWLVFFAGSPVFTRTNLALALRSGARIVDLSGELAGGDGSPWLPGLEQHAAPQLRTDGKTFTVPSAAAEIVIRLTLALGPLQLKSLAATAFRPVSAAGKSGIEELESQTGQLLSFQNVGKELFDTQVAFTLLDRYGPGSAQKLESFLQLFRREVRAFLPSASVQPALQLLHAPVFYGAAVSSYAHLGKENTGERLLQALAGAGFAIQAGDSGPGNVSCAGETVPQLAAPRPDPSADGVWWFWAAADNVRVPAANAVKLAERLLA
ncbi:MAG TPA: Asd/ArgC dimerization domain-containing protein [Dongiaceae bacterium]|nr:Asd/ArgC dimerization domain-containing protein [Dongiaceae bacterium]